MSKNFAQSDPRVIQYAAETFRPEDPVLAEVRVRAQAAGLPAIHVGDMDGLHLEVLARAIGARKAVEIGTLAGYSGICLARAIGPQGRLETFEFEAKHARVAEESFRKAGVLERVRVHVGPAIERLPGIEAEGPFDLVFIDADKTSYPAYLEWAWRNLRPGGLVIGDNTFAWGLIADERFESPEREAAVRALRRFNQEVAQSGKWRATILPTGEGLTVAVKL